MDIKQIPLSEIKPYPKNAKKHPKNQIKQIADSIKEFGFMQPLVVTKDYELVVGHGRCEAAKLLGLTILPVVIAENLTKQQIKAYRLADNKLNESDWDMGLAIEELKELDIKLVELTGFSLDLLIEPDAKDDEVPDLPEEPKSKLGEVYQLGRHFIMCGDSTKLEDVEKLMNGQKADMVFTDPPYNTGMTGKSQGSDTLWKGDGKKKGSTRLSHMFEDSYTPEQWEKFLSNVFSNYYAVTKGEAAFYVCIDWRKVADIKAHLEKLMPVSNVIVWDKMVHGLGSDYKYTYELIIVAKKGKPKINNRFGTDYQDVWHIQRRMGKNEQHATAKPIELCEKPLIHASKTDDIVLDLFLGSGSTLIAAEKTGRICYGMELDPKYIDVIIKRFEDYTGQKAVLL